MKTLYSHLDLGSLDEHATKALLRTLRSSPSLASLVQSINTEPSEAAPFAFHALSLRKATCFDFCGNGQSPAASFTRHLCKDLLRIDLRNLQKLTGELDDFSLMLRYKKCLASLAVHRIDQSTDFDVKSILSQLTHLEHLTLHGHRQASSGTITVGTVIHLLKTLPSLSSLTLGVPVSGIEHNSDFFVQLANLRSVCLHNHPNIRPRLLGEALNACRWRSLEVVNCSGLGIDGLRLTLCRATTLSYLGWCFPDDYEYDWEKYEIKEVNCRKLRELVIVNGNVSTQCFMRIARNCSQLEFVSFSSCEDLHAIKTCSALHYHISNIPLFDRRLDYAFEACASDVRSITFSDMFFDDTWSLTQAIKKLFEISRQLNEIEFRDCIFRSASESSENEDADYAAREKFLQSLSRHHVVNRGKTIRCSI